jgi:hypothetical protein
VKYACHYQRLCNVYNSRVRESTICRPAKSALYLRLRNAARLLSPSKALFVRAPSKALFVRAARLGFLATTVGRSRCIGRICSFSQNLGLQRLASH